MQSPRTPETEAKYEAFKRAKSDDERHQFNFDEEEIIQEFSHWLIIKSRFPYDTMVRVNDLLVSKRPVSSFGELTDEEHNEYHQIIEELSKSGVYDARIENFPKVQSVKKHIHIHLICWHVTELGA